MPNSQPAVNISPEVQVEPYFTVEDRNKAIIAERILNNTRVVDLAKKYQLSDSMISRIVIQGGKDENIRLYVDRYWEKGVIDKSRTLVLNLLDNIDPKKVPMAGIHNLIGTLIDKVRLLQGQATEISEVRVLDMAAMLKALR